MEWMPEDTPKAFSLGPNTPDYGTPTTKLQVTITLLLCIGAFWKVLMVQQNAFDESLPMCYYVSIFLFVLLDV